MTDIIIDMADVAGGTQPGDRVAIQAPAVRPGSAGTRVTHGRTWGVELVAGKGTISGVDPGPLVVQIIPAGGMSTGGTFNVTLPDLPSITLKDLLETSYVYTPPVVEAGVQAIWTARDQSVAVVETAIDDLDTDVAEFKTKADNALTAATAADGKSTTALDKSTTAEAQVTNIDARMVDIESMAGVGPSTPVDGQQASLIDQPGTLTRKAVDKATVLMSPHVDAREFGLWDVTDLDTDVAPILNAAAAKARTLNRPLYVPAPRVRNGLPDLTSGYAVFSTVNFRDITVICEANITVRHNTSVGMVVGHHSSRRSGLSIDLANVKHHVTGLLDTEWDYPALRVIGLKGATIRVGNVSYMQLYADQSIVADGSISYCEIHPQRINHLHIFGKNGGWINENNFYGGSYVLITVEGDYSHNSNIWYKPSTEGTDSLIDFKCGVGNQILNARSEGNPSGTKVRLAARTVRNRIISAYASNPVVMHGGFNVLEDLGKENVISSVASEDHVAHTIFSLSAETVFTDSAQALPGGVKITPALPAGKLVIPQGGVWFDTGLIPLKSGPGDPGNNKTSYPESQVVRFHLGSDKASLRPLYALYDKDGVAIPPDISQVETYGDLKVNTAGTHYIYGTAIAGSVFVIRNPNAHYMSIFCNASGWTDNVRSVQHVTLTAFLREGNISGVVERMRRAVLRPLYGTTAPTQGVAPLGTAIQGPDRQWVSVARADTTISSTVSSTEIQVASTTGIQAGDVIGVETLTGETHWTKVTAVSGSNITLSVGVTNPRPNGRVGTTRWKEIPYPTTPTP